MSNVLSSLGEGLRHAATAARLVEEIVHLVNYARGDSDVRPALLTVLPAETRSKVEHDRQRALAWKRFSQP